MQHHINPNNNFLIDRYLLFLQKEYITNNKFVICMDNNPEIKDEYFNLLRLSFLLGEPFDGRFGLKKIIYNLYKLNSL